MTMPEEESKPFTSKSSAALATEAFPSRDMLNEGSYGMTINAKSENGFHDSDTPAIEGYFLEREQPQAK